MAVGLETTGREPGSTRRSVLKGLGGAALVGTALGADQLWRGPTAHAATRRNVVLVTADDLGQYLGCYGYPGVRTPNLDAFAGSGVRFNQGYVTQASCSPSRSSILTGRWPHDNGQVGLANAYQMRAGVATLPTLLSRAGYRTGIVGKLHVAPESAFRWDYRPLDAVGSRDVRLVAERARSFMTGSPDPFFLMVNYSDPHVASQRAPAFVHQERGIPASPHPPGSVPPLPFQQIDTPVVRERTRGYLNSVERFDAGLGMLMAALRSSGKLDDTLVIVIGDHGAPFARGKTTCYEGGVKIPFLVRNPGRQTAGLVRTHRLVSTIDIVPTVLATAGVAAPAGLPGLSLLPLLTAGPRPWRDVLPTEYTAHHLRTTFYPRRAVRGARFKLIANLASPKRNPIVGVDGDPGYAESRRPEWINTPQGRAMTRHANPPAEELFDLQEDPYEFRNLVADPAYGTQLRLLRGELRAWREASGDPLLDSRALVAGAVPGAR